MWSFRLSCMKSSWKPLLTQILFSIFFSYYHLSTTKPSTQNYISKYFFVRKYCSAINVYSFLTWCILDCWLFSKKKCNMHLYFILRLLISIFLLDLMIMITLYRVFHKSRPPHCQISISDHNYTKFCTHHNSSLI